MATQFESDAAILEAPTVLTGSAGFGPTVKRWKVDEYHKMVELGLIMEGAPIELIDGILVYKDRRDSGGSTMTQGSWHALAVAQLVELNTMLAALGFHIRIQSPVAISPNHEPEPDGLVMPGRPIKYQGRLPPAHEACLVIEVADSSLVFDRTVKHRMYATAAIPASWIVNLRDNVIETYRQPDSLSGEYRAFHEYKRGDAVAFDLPGIASQSVLVTDIIAD